MPISEVFTEIAVLLMIGLTALGSAEGEISPGKMALAVLLKGVAFIVVLSALMKWVLTPLLRRLGRSRELLVLSAVAWAVALSAAAYHLGFSKEVGAFLAGVSIASTPYREVIGSRLVSLRDFLLLFFFIDLGAHLDLGAMTGQVLPSLVLSGFVLVGNPLIVMIIMGSMGYRKRTSFLAGLTVAQISEFSLILAALGLRLGHLDAQVLGSITLVGLVTISLSTYMILYSEPLYRFLAPWLGIFEKKNPGRKKTERGNLAEAENGGRDRVRTGAFRAGVGAGIAGPWPACHGGGQRPGSFESTCPRRHGDGVWRCGRSRFSGLTPFAGSTMGREQHS
jgi:Kef-type K+ transport system membrane component KefB